MLWIILFILLFLIGLAVIGYLVYSAQKIGFVEKLSHGHTLLRWIIGAALIIVPSMIFWILLGFINMVTVLLHLAVFTAIADLALFIIAKCRKKKAKNVSAGIIAILVTAAYLGIGWVGATYVTETDYTIRTDKSIGTLRIALLADSHIGTTFDGDGFKKHLSRICEQDPDVMVIVGDFVDESSEYDDMVTACRALGSIKVRYGIYFVFGNHDKGKYSDGRRGYNADDLTAELKKNGVNVLEDEAVLIDDRFYLIGRQDASEELDFGGSRADISKLTEGLNKENYSIVLDHQPRDYKKEADAGVDLVLSGHTHGGQMIPLVQLMKWFHFGNDNVYGSERRGNTDFIVTSGISDWAFCFKTGCKSEYVIIDIIGK